MAAVDVLLVLLGVELAYVESVWLVEPEALPEVAPVELVELEADGVLARVSEDVEDVLVLGEALVAVLA